MEKSILDVKGAHARLVADLPHVCELANVPPSYVHNSIKGICTKDETDWVVNFHKNRASGVAGLAMVGTDEAEKHMLAMAGAFLRNYIDARVVTKDRLLAMATSDVITMPTVLLVPNFFIQGYGKGQPSYKVQALYDLLLSRFTASKPTVLYIEDFAAMRKEYGEAIASHIKAHYKQTE